MTQKSNLYVTVVQKYFVNQDRPLMPDHSQPSKHNAFRPLRLSSGVGRCASNTKDTTIVIAHYFIFYLRLNRHKM